MTWILVANRLATEVESSVQNTVMSATTLLIIIVAMRGVVDKRNMLKIVLFVVSGSNTGVPPSETNLEPLYPSRGIEIFHLKYLSFVLHMSVSSSPKQK